MKRLILLPIFGMFIVLSFWGLSYAQMSGCGGRSQMDKSAEVGMDNMNHMEMMKDMPKQCQEMSGRFESLENNFQKMMKIDDLEELKVAMQKHHGMMQQMHSNMMEHGKMCQNMTAMMSGSDDMTQTNMEVGTEVGTMDHADHNH